MRSVCGRDASLAGIERRLRRRRAALLVGKQLIDVAQKIRAARVRIRRGHRLRERGQPAPALDRERDVASHVRRDAALEHRPQPVVGERRVRIDLRIVDRGLPDLLGERGLAEPDSTIVFIAVTVSVATA